MNTNTKTGKKFSDGLSGKTKGKSSKQTRKTNSEESEQATVTIPVNRPPAFKKFY